MSRTKKSGKTRRKWKKYFPLASTAAVILLISASIYGGNFLCHYALSNQSGSDNRKKEDPSFRTQAQLDADRVKRQEDAAGADWHNKTPYENVQVISDDQLTLKGEFYENPGGGHDYVVLVHGYKRDQADMYAYGYQYFAKGYNVLTMDLRAQGESEGEYIGMGWLDRLDLLKWIGLIIDRDDQARIVLHGVSMGAAAVMMAEGEDLPAQVKAVVEDCGYTDVWSIFSQEMRYRFGLREFPVLYAANLCSKFRNGYSFREASCIAALKKSQTPTLFIHGDADDFVPFDMLDQLYNAAACEKERYAVPGAGHAEAKNYNIETYFNTVFQFLDKYISAPL